ncbi:hypothetical protein A2801_01615 [Candidatus Woesebacteria bacterium RIFCSPHIGHO2_01_FULL_41_10]|uniref:AAA+ ATPase domain-containing protein n=1 Tax=Candidatus Woesebacteria bacterium RIFCSPHIGHO2_01_FULL_41_10 TaxID=1802500 RepID=A0A1F7YPV1_9BACT|nr:MAG: hypothetical protein A2801_01615 [Candidatus Woesebacteria bacterium RIFCSPHIGHO2_01_FULL_41_10]
MKILLTGKPGIGKSTILEKVKYNFSGNKFGVISKEVKKNNKRVGFEAINHAGEKRIFAHTTDIASDYIIGDKYFVDLKAIDNFVVPELEKGINNPESLVFIDEIGRMQAFSGTFLKTVGKVLNSSSNILATIVFDPEPWSIEFKENKNVVLVRVYEENRDLLPGLLGTIFDHSSDFHKLSKSQQKFVIDLTRKYFEEENFIQISKLFKNAITYVVEKRVKVIKPGELEVKGNTDTHKVEKQKNGFRCDCDLFNGRGQYNNNHGECSHIQTVKLLEIN